MYKIMQNPHQLKVVKFTSTQWKSHQHQELTLTDKADHHGHHQPSCILPPPATSNLLLTSLSSSGLNIQCPLLHLPHPTSF